MNNEIISEARPEVAGQTGNGRDVLIYEMFQFSGTQDSTRGFS